MDMRGCRLLKCKLLYNILIFLSLSLNSWKVAGQTENAFVKDSLDKYILRAMAMWSIPGVAVGIVKNDTIVYSKGFGTNDLSKQSKVDNTTLFPIWSMGKSFTAFSLALMEERSQIKLEDKV